MTTSDLARFFVRFQAAILLLYGIINVTYLGPYVRALHTLYPNPATTAAVSENFWAAILRVALYLLGSTVLFGKTDAIVLLFGGRQGTAGIGHDHD